MRPDEPRTSLFTRATARENLLRALARSLAPALLACACSDPAVSGAGACPARHFAAGDACISAVTSVAAGAHHTCALHADGTVTCWGSLSSTDGTASAPTPPRAISGFTGVVALAAGDGNTCAILGPQRRVHCFAAEERAVLLEDGSPLEGALSLGVGSAFACAASAAGVHCWGENARGQLARPLEVANSEPALLALARSTSALGAGEAVFGYAAGQLCSWGDNATQLITPQSDIGLYTEPQCRALAEVAQLAVGSVHACARSQDGAVRCWGERYYGQLGIGGTDDDTADVPPPGTPALLPAFAEDLVAGVSHSCALLPGGAVVCFGLNSLGQIGASDAANTAALTTQQVRSPEPVPGFEERVFALGAGSSAQHTCAIIEQGNVACWGNDDAGQLGDRVTEVDAARFSALPVHVAWR